VNQVVNTPLYPSVHDDRLVWTKENDGEYSVRSAYKMCMQELLDVNHFKAQGNWDLIWKLKVPPKVKNFIWRVCRNTLPTRLRLKEKGVNCDPTCALCNLTEEDSFHIFFRCPGSCNIWSMCDFFNTENNVINQGQENASVIFQLLQVLNGDEAALFCCILWSIWKQRNNKVWNDVTEAQVAVLERAKVLL